MFSCFFLYGLLLCWSQITLPCHEVWKPIHFCRTSMLCLFYDSLQNGWKLNPRSFYCCCCSPSVNILVMYQWSLDSTVKSSIPWPQLVWNQLGLYSSDRYIYCLCIRMCISKYMGIIIMLFLIKVIRLKEVTVRVWNNKIGIHTWDRFLDLF